jgi:NAD(P)H dehydrogenase (quinone)
MSKILITGATGHLGKATIESLLNNTTVNKIVAMARDVNKSANLVKQGMEVRIGNFDNKSSLERAFQGINKLLISGLDKNRLQQHKNAIDSAKKAGVEHIIYTGVALKDLTASSIRPLMEDHFLTENYIKENNFKYTFLRNSLYMDALPLFTGIEVLETGICLPAENGKVPFVLRKDLAEATANILLQDGHENKTYQLTGKRLHSYSDIAEMLSNLSGNSVGYAHIEVEHFMQSLKDKGLNNNTIAMLTGFIIDIKNGLYELQSDDLEMLLGRKPASLSEELRKIFSL